MYRDTHTFEMSAAGASADWEVAPANIKPASAPVSGEDEVGAVWHVYREIARRIARNAYTRHASTLAK